MRGAIDKLPYYLADLQETVQSVAREAGLDFFDIIFEVVNFDQMNEIAAYGGFPARYPHWRFGMEYNTLSKSSTYGLHKIYELVINNDPCYAYLLEGNSLVEQKMVMAHVMAHCDFFKNNLFFENTNRKMMDEIANHRTRIVSLMEKLGIETVEWFIDACLSIENLIDVVKGKAKKFEPEIHDSLMTRHEASKTATKKSELNTPPYARKEYMERFIKSPKEADSASAPPDEPAVKPPSGKIPDHSRRDVMGFLLNNAPLKEWEQTVLEIIRDEAYYFAPQAQTKILNEGWATYWHSKLLTEKLLNASEIIEYADRASAITATSGVTLNPYKLGVELLKDIEERWDKGRFGKEWEECTDAELKSNWDTGAGKGKDKIFEVRRIYNDLMFLDEFLTEDFCRRNKFFTFGFNEKSGSYEIFSRKFEEIKKTLLYRLTNLGNPIIEVEDGNFENRGELLLRHCHDGVDLRMDWAQETLKNIYKIWKRPVLIMTVIQESPVMLKFDGKEHTKKPL